MTQMDVKIVKVRGASNRHKHAPTAETGADITTKVASVSVMSMFGGYTIYITDSPPFSTQRLSCSPRHTRMHTHTINEHEATSIIHFVKYTMSTLVNNFWAATICILEILGRHVSPNIKSSCAECCFSRLYFGGHKLVEIFIIICNFNIMHSHKILHQNFVFKR